MPLFTNIQSLPLLVAEGGGFDVFDPNGAGNFLWTLLIFALSFPLMWKMVFGPIVSALIERDAKASEAIHAAEAASEAAERRQLVAQPPRQRQARRPGGQAGQVGGQRAADRPSGGAGGPASWRPIGQAAKPGGWPGRGGRARPVVGPSQVSRSRSELSAQTLDRIRLAICTHR